MLWTLIASSSGEIAEDYEDVRRRSVELYFVGRIRLRGKSMFVSLDIFGYNFIIVRFEKRATASSTILLLGPNSKVSQIAMVLTRVRLRVQFPL
jgi:hypothetical protein